MEEKTKNKGIETYAGDLASVLDSKEEGLVRKLIHEQEELDSETRKNSPESKQNQKFLFIGLILIIVALGALSFILMQKKKSEVVAIAPQYKPIIFIEKTEFKDITGLLKDEISKVIATEANVEDAKLGIIEGLYLTENKQQIVGLRRMLGLLGSGFYPEEAYVSNNFLMGTVYNETNNDFFMILQVSAFVDVFESFKKWEKTMFKDLNGSLGIVVNAENNYLLNKTFDDGVFENKNTRILHDKEGKIVLMYIFAKDNFVVITEREESARELLLRLSGVKIEK